MKTSVQPAIEVKQDGTRMLVTKLRVGDLTSFTRVDAYDSSRNVGDPLQGYQRPAEMPRVKQFANWLRREREGGNRVRMPTAILLSARGSDMTLSREGTVEFKECNKLPLVDGQHRSEGFRYAIDEKALAEFADYEVPVVVMMDLDKQGEMEQFRIVNGTQKSVRTDLVNMILSQLAEHRGEETLTRTEMIKVVVSRTVRRLNRTKGGPWEDRIVMPDERVYSQAEQNEHPERRHLRTARATSFMSALKPIQSYLLEHFTGEKDIDGQVEELYRCVSAFWEAVRDLNPECFEEAGDYVMLKTPGLFALSIMCLRVMKDMYVGKREWTREEFRTMLEDCGEVANPAYWAVGTDESNRGDAAKYGSMKGFSELAVLLYEDLRG